MPLPALLYRRLLWHDLAIFSVMAILAGCGLIYEYLLSHYAGRVLGTMESAIYGIIGTMIVVWPYYRWVAVAQVPYLMWVSIATVLQLSITWMNWGK